jgi:hypothetical protein
MDGHPDSIFLPEQTIVKRAATRDSMHSAIKLWSAKSGKLNQLA